MVPFFGVRKAFAAFADEVVSIAKENIELRKLLGSVLEYLDPAGRQDMCNKECPAYEMCAGKTECKFLEWANQKANEI